MTGLDLRAAAAERAAAVAQRSHRPRRRSAPGGHRARTGPLRAALRAEATGATGALARIRGVASVTETPYDMWDVYGEYREVVAQGAFGESLARADLDVPLVLGHDQLRRLARTTSPTCRLRLSETSDGLDVEADVDPTEADTAYILGKLERGLLDEMSFAFEIVSGVWSPDYSEYRIQRVDLHRGDVAIVGWGANPATSVVEEDVAPDVPPVRGASALELTRARIALALALPGHP